MNVFKFSWRDFKNQKIRAAFGIGGILISVFLLTTVGVMIDTLNFNYLDTATIQAGSSDILITKTVSSDLSFEPFFDQNYIEDQLRNEEEIDYLFPRIMQFVDVEPLGKLEEKARIIFYGIDSDLEQNSGRLGDLRIIDPETLEDTGALYTGPIPEGHAIILKNTATILNVTVGDFLTLTYTRYSVNLTIDAICTQVLRFSAVETNLIITELEEAQKFLDEEGKINNLYATLRYREFIYNTRNIAGTTEDILEIGARLQEQLGFEYIIELPKLAELETVESETMMMEVMMSFATFLAVMISAILINSVLTTSVEERIREFGVMRVLGGKNRENVAMVIIQGLFIGLIGTGVGVIISVFFVPAFLLWIYQIFNISPIPPFIVLPETVVLNFFIGIGVTLAISVFPAFKAGNLNITNAIDPFRHVEEGYKLKKEGSPNSKIILIGASISTIGLLIFILFPRIMATGDLSIVSSLFIGLLIVILMGLVFALVGIVPAFEWLILQLFKPFIRKFHPIVSLSIKRNQRRNTGNVIMFALSFSFIFFISSFMEINKQSSRNNLEFQYGADLVVFNQGTSTEGDSINPEFLRRLLDTPGIKEAAPVLHNSVDFSQIIALTSGDFDLTSLTNIGSDISMSNSGSFNFGSLFSRFFSEEEKYDTFVGSITSFQQVRCGFIGVNQSYVDLSQEKYYIWDAASGSSTQASFGALFDTERNDTVIISKNIADRLGVTQLNQKIRLTFADSTQGASRNSGNATTMTVVGISGGMPGFWNFRSSALITAGSGVMMSMENYLAWMNLGTLTNQSTTLDKILINLEDVSEEGISDVKSLVNDLFEKDYDFLVDDNISKIGSLLGDQTVINMILEIVLTITIVIALFGLVSTMYSTLVERMFEIGLLRAMGLKGKDVNSMFVVESLVLMLSSGTVGLFIGSYTAFMLMDNIAILMEMPIAYVVSIPTLFRIYLLSISLCFIGIYMITYKIKKWSIMDIFRRTF